MEIRNETIAFYFNINERGEHFAPPPKYDKVVLDKTALKSALEKVNIGLNLFAKRILKIKFDGTVEH